MLRQSRSILLTLLALVLTVGASADDQWRIAVGGGRITGYMGLLAKHGLPREYVPESDLSKLDVLKQYRVVIITSPIPNDAAIVSAVEQFVAEGGIAITEELIRPSAGVLPGKRINPARSANTIFADVDHPIARAMRGAGLVPTQGSRGAAIIPAENSGATVLAHFTDEGVPEKYRGELTGGRKDIPAAIVFKHGKGSWLYFGGPVAITLALRGPQMQPGIVAALAHLSDGVLVPRLTDLPADRRLVPSVQWQPEAGRAMRRPVSRDEKVEEAPEGFQSLELPEDAPADYLVSATVNADTEAVVMLPWLNDDYHQRLEIDGQSLRLVEVIAGRPSLLGTAGMLRAEKQAEIIIRRRPSGVTVFVGREPLLMAPLQPMAGMPFAAGLEDAFLQPCAPVTFGDDFMRAEGDPNPWETPSGSWKLYQVEGEPGQGANPFAFRAQGEGTATAVTGYWFWDDYDLSAAVRPDTNKSVSLLAHWQSPEDCVALTLHAPFNGKGTLSLTRRLPEGEQVLASAEVQVERERWHELRLRISRGHVLAGVDGRDLLHVADDLLRGRGQIGLELVTDHPDAYAYFDDVHVQPWEAVPQPLLGTGAWIVERGTLEQQGAEVALAPAGSARAIAPVAQMSDLRARARLRRGDADSAALLLRYQGPGDHYRLELVGSGGDSQLRLVRVRRAEETVLAAAPVDGNGGRWHEVEAVMQGRHMVVMANGVRAFEVADDAVGAGGFGLTCTGSTAQFADATCWPIDHESFAADPPTPPYAGIIDEHTWAGAGSGWQPSPDDLDLFWHRGLYVDDVEIRLGVHRAANGEASASLYSGNPAAPEDGYVLSAYQSSSAEPVRLQLDRAGEQVATGEIRNWGAEGYALSLQRIGSLLVARVNGQTVCDWRDPEPLADVRSVGFRRDVAVIDPADAEVVSSALRTWTFESAPADWRSESGTWEISNRWSCSPQWTWLAGWNQDGEALIHSRRGFVGDQVVDLYVGAKMMPNPNGKGHYEELRDLHFGLCGDAGGGGYRVILGGENNTRTVLLRNGVQVAEAAGYTVPQAERHNNWLLVRLVKSGPTLSVRVWDSEVLSYTDPEPLEAGSFFMGTERNGIIIPRVTVYARGTIE